MNFGLFIIGHFGQYFISHIHIQDKEMCQKIGWNHYFTSNKKVYHYKSEYTPPSFIFPQFKTKMQIFGIIKLKNTTYKHEYIILKWTDFYHITTKFI